jgi:large subunit ribosomal protein L25
MIRYMTVTLPIKERVTSGNAEVDLKVGIPGVVYGPKQTPLSVVVDRKEFEKLFKVVGESAVIALNGVGSPINVLVKDVSFAPTKGGIVHIDFYAIEKGKEIETHVPLHFIGEAPVLKQGAVINKVLHEVTVSCQADSLPAALEVDLSAIETIDARITVADIVCPKGVTIMHASDEVVALAEAVVEHVEEAPEVAPEAVAESGKVEEAPAA